MNIDFVKDPEYKQWLVDLKTRIRQSQMRAMIKVNDELLRLYWDLGHDIVVRQMDSAWGSGFFKNLSRELKTEFPDAQGFSERNLYNMKRFYLFYSQDSTILHQAGAELRIGNLHQLGAEIQESKNKDVAFVHQAGGQIDVHPIFQIPWRHHVEIFTKCKSVHEALFYVQKTIENGWSRDMLANFMDLDLYQSQGKSINNFDRLLPDVQSDLAKQTLKDPYNFGFLSLTEKYKEKELEDALVENITKFLLELGQGFAFVGRQYPIQIGSVPRNIDLLFYHLKLRCYVVIELKVKKFEPEHTGKLGYYIVAIDEQVKTEADNPTIGLLICRKKDNIEVKYSLKSSNQPIGISEYDLSKLMPEDFKSSLPSIDEIENELNKNNEEE
ncbi:MAG: PDDEXK nuclease domain-containing protein [Dysgonamonadaceae bacterium]|jgi:predicted nuclease of restriction endonuclease-like (RecB) superfamily|nr:PDDEXK nuclease domain-containing protein [Dysgonamonadaceae bacterium]